MGADAGRPRRWAKLAVFQMLRGAVGFLSGTIFLSPALSGQPAEEAWNRVRLLSALGGLRVSAETQCSTEAIEPSAWAGKQDEIAALHGGRLSPYDGVVFPNYHYVQIEHIVARKEADESGMCYRGDSARTHFASDLLNLTLAPGSLNASKGDTDVHDVQSAETSLFRDSLTDHALCWWTAQTVRVKSKYRLSVDPDERAAMLSILNDCADASVFRPKLVEGSDWTFRAEFLDELAGEHAIPMCSEGAADAFRLRSAAIVVSSHLPNIACIPGDPEEAGDDTETTVTAPTAPVTIDPRAGQKAAQTACMATLKAGGHSTTCTNIGRYCPSVDPILRGEPLYQPKGTNGRSNDSDDDGTYCEGL